MRPAALGAMGWLLVVLALYLSAYDLLTPRTFRDALRREDALTGELDETLACDLVTDFVKLNEFGRKVSCDGELVSLGDVARLQDVLIEKEHRTFCLARAPMWTVLRSTREMPCFPTPPPASGSPLEAESQRVHATASEQLNEWAEGIRLAMATTERPSACPRVFKARTGIEVPLLEYELLEQSGGDPAWAFLTTSWLREALVERESYSALTVSRNWTENRPWVAVVTSASREPPNVVGITWSRGHLTGTISLVDAAAGQLICEREFSFRSSDTLEPEYRPSYGYKRYNIAPLIAPLELPTEARVNADFKRRYESAALRTINEMTSYGVRTSLY